MVDKKTVEYIAGLARINVTEEEKVSLPSQLSKILDYIDTLKKADVDNIPPTQGIVREDNLMREDNPVKCSSSREILENAPDREGDYFKIPRVIE